MGGDFASAPNQACCLVGHDAPLARVRRGKSPAAGFLSPGGRGVVVLLAMTRPANPRYGKSRPVDSTAAGAAPGLFFSWEAATILLPNETARDGTGCEAPGTSRAADHLWDMSSAPARGCRWHVPARRAPTPGGSGALG